MNDSNPKPYHHAEAERFFDHIAEDYRNRSEGQSYNTSSMSFRRRQDLVSSQIAKSPKNGTILDYGMGPAVFAKPCSELGCHYIGIDISPKMVELAEEQEIDNCEFVVGDLETLENYQSAADTVLLIGLIDYLDEPKSALAQLGGCVRPGGQIVMSIRNRRSVPRLLRDVSKKIWGILSPKKTAKDDTTAFEAPVLERSFVPKRDLIPTLLSNGFDQYEIHYLDCSPIFFKVPLPKFIWHLGLKVDKLLSRPVLSWMCASGVVVARKPPATS